MSQHSLSGVGICIRQVVKDPELDQESDRALLRRFAVDGEQAAFETVLRRHASMVMSICRRTLSDARDAEDAFQAVFCVMAKKAAAPFWQDSAAGWLAKVA